METETAQEEVDRLSGELSANHARLTERMEMERHEFFSLRADGVCDCGLPANSDLHIRACPGFHTGDRDYCDGDEPDAGQSHCAMCRKAAESVRTAAEDKKWGLTCEGSWTEEALNEYKRVVALCEEVLGK